MHHRAPEVGVDWVRLVHGEQGIRIHKKLPVEGRLVGRTKLTGLVDKGEGKGAVLIQERVVKEAASGDKLFTIVTSIFVSPDTSPPWLSTFGLVGILTSCYCCEASSNFMPGGACHRRVLFAQSGRLRFGLTARCAL